MLVQLAMRFWAARCGPAVRADDPREETRELIAMTPIRVSAVFYYLALAAFPRPARPADPPLPPGVPPVVAPSEARKTLQVAKGLDARLVAHEPMVRGHPRTNPHCQSEPHCNVTLPRRRLMV